MDIKEELSKIKEIGHVAVLNNLYRQEIELNKKYYIVEVLFTLEKIKNLEHLFKEKNISSITLLKEWKRDYNDEQYISVDIEFTQHNGKAAKYKLTDDLCIISSSIGRLVKYEFIDENTKNNIELNTIYNIELNSQGMNYFLSLLLNEELLKTYHKSSLDINLSEKKSSNIIKKI